MSTTFVEAERLDSNRVRLLPQSDLDIVLYANTAVLIDRASLREVRAIAGIAETVSELVQHGFFGDYPAKLHRAVLTPDFHKGAGIPIGTVLDADGFVLPRCAGTDIGCGMRVLITDLSVDEFARADKLDDVLRHAFFQGGRDIPLDPANRAGLLRDGILGLRPLSTGLWRAIDPQQMLADLDRTHHLGTWPTNDLWMFDDYVQGSGGIGYDAAIATIGGGNHFVEIQRVDACLDRATCWRWGIKQDRIAIMVHTGSVSFGGMVGDHYVATAQKAFPAGLKRPGHGYLPLSTVGPQPAGTAYLSAMGLAANFAVVNRMFLAALTLRCLSQAIGREVAGHLVYDAPHNLVWSDGQRHIHRKGATPADCDPADAQFPDGHPVIIPGSMGDASYVMRGTGAIASLCSAPHGAGRRTARSEGRRASVSELDRLRVITKIDLRQVRREIADEYHRTLLEEAPSHYKPVLPVIDTVADAGMAVPVARLWPLLTIKG